MILVGRGWSLQKPLIFGSCLWYESFMFSGIVEAQSGIEKWSDEDGVVRLHVQRPPHFDDLKVGDSICTNGVCLSIENFDEGQIRFCLAAESLRILGDGLAVWKKYPVNLERSLQLGARIHGHLVSGHVDDLAEVTESHADGESWQMAVKVSPSMFKFFWRKGSVCLNGVSLTVNEVSDGQLFVCLIPETIHATNLARYKVGEKITIEADYLAKAYFNSKSGELS